MAGQPSERIVAEGVGHAVGSRHRRGVAVRVVAVAAGQAAGGVGLQPAAGGGISERGVLHAVAAAADAVADGIVPEPAQRGRRLRGDQPRQRVVAEVPGFRRVHAVGDVGDAVGGIDSVIHHFSIK